MPAADSSFPSSSILPQRAARYAPPAAPTHLPSSTMPRCAFARSPAMPMRAAARYVRCACLRDARVLSTRSAMPRLMARARPNAPDTRRLRHASDKARTEDFAYLMMDIARRFELEMQRDAAAPGAADMRDTASHARSQARRDVCLHHFTRRAHRICRAIAARQPYYATCWRWRACEHRCEKEERWQESTNPPEPVSFITSDAAAARIRPPRAVITPDHRYFVEARQRAQRLQRLAFFSAHAPHSFRRAPPVSAGAVCCASAVFDALCALHYADIKREAWLLRRQMPKQICPKPICTRCEYHRHVRLLSSLIVCSRFAAFFHILQE